MIRRMLAVPLTALALMPLHAGAVTFFDAVLDATAVASTLDGALGYDSVSSPPADAPVSAAADSVGATDIATAGAFAGDGLLTANADVASAGGVASAVGTAHFSGSFDNAVKMVVTIDFFALDATVGAASAATTLFVTLSNAGSVLFDDYVTADWTWTYAAAPGSASWIDLTLASEVSAAVMDAAAGNASGFGQAAFAVSAVPMPAPWWLFAVGVPTIAAVVRRRAAARREVACAV